MAYYGNVSPWQSQVLGSPIPVTPVPPTLNVAIPTIHHDQSWYMDLNASQHLIWNQNNLKNAALYAGHEQVMLGNGNISCRERLNSIWKPIFEPK